MDKNALMLVFSAALISGFSVFVNSFGVKSFDSSVFTFSKNILVSLFLLSIIIFFKQFDELKKLSSKHWKQLITIGLVGGSVPFLLFFKGLQLTAGTTSAFIHKTLFIYASIFALIFLKEKLNIGFIIGAALLLVGSYLMLLPDFDFSIGHFMILFATVFWAAENIISKHALKELSGTVVAFGRMFFGSFFIFLFLMFTGKLDILVSMSFEQYLWIFLTSVFLLLFLFNYYNGLKRVKVSAATAILAIGAPITTALSWIFSSASVSLTQAFGMLMIVFGIIFVVWFADLASYLRNTFDAGADEG
jgi:drug/metabolite transporter (DMT)-like permease